MGELRYDYGKRCPECRGLGTLPVGWFIYAHRPFGSPHRVTCAICKGVGLATKDGESE